MRKKLSSYSTGQPNKKFFDFVNEVKGDYEKKISNTEENLITAQELNDYFVTIGPELSSDFKNRVIFPKILQVQILRFCQKLMNKMFVTRKSNCPTKNLKMTWVCQVT